MSYPSLQVIAAAKDWEGFAEAVDSSFFARLLLEPVALTEGFAAVPDEWLWANPRYLMAGAIARAANHPYSLIPEGVHSRFASWVEGQEQPATRDLLGVAQTQLRALLAAGRLEEADAAADESLRLIAEPRDTAGFDDVLPPVFIRIGMVKLLRGDVRDAIGIFAEGSRRASAVQHPIAPHVGNFAALSHALAGNFVHAEQSLTEMPPSTRPAGSMQASYFAISQYAAALIALGTFRAEPSEHLPDTGIGEFWWLTEHIRAKRSLYGGGDRGGAAAHLEDILDLRRDLSGSGTFASNILRTDLADLYMADHNFQAAAHVLRREVPTSQGQKIWAARARLALLGGNPARALQIVAEVQRLNGGRHRLVPAIWIVKAAAERILGDTSASAVSMDNASEALKRTNAIAEIVGAHPIIREELAHRLHVEQTLPASIYAPAQSITLSERERDVLRALALYGSTKELAAALHVSPNTAKSHLASVYKKLGVHGREQALRAAAAWLDD
ncbi:hypothetical protein ITJ66_16720 [Plantibacter sp. VKM Ac-2885]|uniref:helix-turn-helix transcriptional regulator n=1 Tax=Plantibacter sp. VKM Ac-2885 TaxID=2783828 RepID=UPI00188C3E62|nr:hypothetical protein [Plantibacter sp. VKM Ac-2885]